jgi:hypothetical protein
MDAPRDINDGAEWSEMDIADLKSAVAYGRSLEEVAEFLCRSGTPLDVDAKAKELGLTWRRKSENPMTSLLRGRGRRG